ncbi:MAG TPA: hypothetical protein VL856_03980 [Acidimicrobiia bacterium]|jgi:hypothetical protein|nr:hypothetical protein [Acidimicrobiia bacterium]
MEVTAPFEPIAGVDLETYARIEAVLLRLDVKRADAGAAVRAFGIPADAWDEACAGWSERIVSDETVRSTYAELYANARRARSTKPFVQ